MNDLRLYFQLFFDKPHFGPFSVFHAKYLIVLGNKKKIQTRKWGTAEKFRPQKLEVTKGFFIFKVVSDFDCDHFLEN